MSPYRPKLASALSLSLGTWAAAGRADRVAYLLVDPRLFAWFVNQAAARSALQYQIRLGVPAAKVTLS